MRKKVSKLLLMLLTCVLILSLTACAGGGTSVEQTTSSPEMTQTNTSVPETTQTTTSSPGTAQTTAQPVESVCAITEERVGQDVQLTGELGFIDRNNPEGIFAELEEGHCQVGIFVNREQWESWTDEEQSLLKTGAKVVAEGQLNSFDGQLVVDLFSPLRPADNTAPEPVQENTVTTSAPALAELNLVAEPLAEKRLSVEKIYSGGEGVGLCYLGSYAMLAKFADNDIDFSDVITNCGIATSAFYVPEINLLLNGFEIGSMAVAAGNQGFDYYIAALKGAGLTDEFLAANLVEEAKQIVSVNNEEEAFELLKRLISSGIPVMVHLDINYIREDLIAYCPYWKDIFDWQDAHMGSTHIDHYMSVNGYDQGFMYLNDPTEKQENLGTDIPIDIANFLNSWKNGNHPSLGDESRIGPYWMLFLGKRGTAKSADELISWNKVIASDAVPSIRQAAVNPNVSELIQCNGMYRARKEFAAFLKANGYEEAGDIFIEISELFGNLRQSPDQQADLLRIADLQEQSLAKW
ncbi:C39 family peptidase [Chloroflexota bacterium]